MTVTTRTLTYATGAALLLAAAPAAEAAYIFTSSNLTITENFDDYAGSSDGPTNWTTSGQTTSRSLDDGSSNSGGVRAYRTSNADTNRAFGFLPSGTGTLTANAEFTNSTGSTIIGLDIDYLAQQFRTAASRTNGWAVSFVDADNTVTEINSLNQAFAHLGGTDSAVNPRGSSTSEFSKSGSLANLSIADGASFFLRFFGDNGPGSGARQGIAIDDLSVTATLAAVVEPDPEPSFASATFEFTADLGQMSSFTFSGGLEDATSVSLTGAPSFVTNARVVGSQFLFDANPSFPGDLGVFNFGITATGPGGSSSAAISLNVIPEPLSALAGVGGLGLIALRRRATA